MKNSLRVKQESNLVTELLKVELRISTELSTLSTDTLQTIEQAIVASVSNVLQRSSKKVPSTDLISSLTIWKPEFRNETRYTVIVFSNSSPSKTEE